MTRNWLGFLHSDEDASDDEDASGADASTRTLTVISSKHSDS
jgi:hypothetical protein